MPTKASTKRGEYRAIEAKLNRSLRIFVTAALVITLVIPVIESTFTLTSTGQFIARAIDLAAAFTMLLTLIRSHLLDRELNRRVCSKDAQ